MPPLGFGCSGHGHEQGVAGRACRTWHHSRKHTLANSLCLTHAGAATTVTSSADLSIPNRGIAKVCARASAKSKCTVSTARCVRACALAGLASCAVVYCLLYTVHITVPVYMYWESAEKEPRSGQQDPTARRWQGRIESTHLAYGCFPAGCMLMSELLLLEIDL